MSILRNFIDQIFGIARTPKNESTTVSAIAIATQEKAEQALFLQQVNRQLADELSARQAMQERLQVFSSRLQILRQLDLAILSEKSAGSIADAVLRHVRRLIPCQRASVVVFDYAAAEAILLAVNHDGVNPYLQLGVRIPFSSFTIIEEYQNSHDPSALSMAIRDVDPGNINLRVEGIVRHAQIPMCYKSELIGSLNLGLGSGHSLSDEHIEIARDVANSMALAIQQASLHDQIRLDAEQLAQQVVALQQAEADLEKERQSLAERVEQRTVELRAANQELANALRMKDEFLATMSHELRTPLNAIMAYAELMESGIQGNLSFKQTASVQNIQEASQHLLALINDVLDVAKMGAQTMQMQIEQQLLNLSKLCETCVRMVQQNANEKQLTIEFSCDQRLDSVKADDRRLKQILTNLLNNAVKFTPSGGRIGLDVYADEISQQLRFAVWDTGIGIAKENLERIFQPFVQIDARLARSFGGAGLGLALAQQLAHLHGGDIVVESTPGKGSRFTLRLPLTLARLHPALSPVGATQLAAPASEMKQQEMEQRSTAKQKTDSSVIEPGVSAVRKPVLLIAEDNEQNCQTMVEYLQHQGFVTIVAKNGHEAIERAQQQHPDLIVMDIQMPEMDGLSAIEQLRAKGNALPIIAVTGLAMRDDEQRCLNAGADAYLSKPVKLRALLSVINSKIALPPQ